MQTVTCLLDALLMTDPGGMPKFPTYFHSSKLMSSFFLLVLFLFFLLLLLFLCLFLFFLFFVSYCGHGRQRIRSMILDFLDGCGQKSGLPGLILLSVVKVGFEKGLFSGLLGF